MMVKLDRMCELLRRKWLHASASQSCCNVSLRNRGIAVGARHSHQVNVKSRPNPDQSQPSNPESQANASPLQMHRGQQAAVDDVHLTRSIRSGVGGEEESRLGELVRLSLSTKGQLGINDGKDIFHLSQSGNSRFRHRRPESAGHQHIDPDAVRREFERQRAVESDHACFRSRVGGAIGLRRKGMT